jgi:hypothetical protein
MPPGDLGTQSLVGLVLGRFGSGRHACGLIASRRIGSFISLHNTNGMFIL